MRQSFKNLLGVDVVKGHGRVTVRGESADKGIVQMKEGVVEEDEGVDKRGDQ